jgi:hypothetical protein
MLLSDGAAAVPDVAATRFDIRANRGQPRTVFEAYFQATA